MGFIMPPLYRAEGIEGFLDRTAKEIALMFQSVEAPTMVIVPSIARDLVAAGMTKQDVKQWLYDHTFWTKKEYEGRAWRDRPTPEEIAVLPDDAPIRVIGSSYGYRGKEDGGKEDTPDNICIVVAGGEEQFGCLTVGPKHDICRLFVTSVDKWR